MPDGVKDLKAVRDTYVEMMREHLNNQNIEYDRSLDHKILDS